MLPTVVRVFVHDMCVQTWKREPTCVCAYVSFEVERIIEAFVAKGAQVPLGLVVTLDVAV